MSQLDPHDRAFAPSLRVCFKPMDGVQNGGCFLDVYAPPGVTEVGKPVPLALYIHGGAFAMGSSASLPYREVRWLGERGVAVVSVEYRMLPHVTLKEIREDILDGYRFIQKGLNDSLAPQGWSVDPTRVSAWGASAGGGAVLLLAADIIAAKLQPLRAIVPVYPFADFRGYVPNRSLADVEALCASDHAFGDAYKLISAGKVVTGCLMMAPEGTTDMALAARQRFTHTARVSNVIFPLLIGDPPFSPTMSPAEVVSAEFPPTFIVIATADDAVLPAMSYAIVDRLKALDVEVEIGEAEGMGHGGAEVHQSEPKWPEGVQWWETAIEPSLQFVLRHLRA